MVLEEYVPLLLIEAIERDTLYGVVHSTTAIFHQKESQEAM